jgi:3-oxoacyl-[acyl-carrier-protein] synthase II
MGNDWPTIRDGFKAGRTGVRAMADWSIYDGLNCLLAAPIEGPELPAHYTRKRIRSMGRMSILGTLSIEGALTDAGLLDDPVLQSGRAGIAYGASSGSIEPLAAFGLMLRDRTTRGITATTYLKMMSHTAAVNAGLFFGINGRMIPTSTACTSGSMAIGYSYENIKFGMQDVMVAGGSEELSATQTAVFDTLYATSTRNDEPDQTPRPFDVARDGLVIGEGGCTLILEELEHAKARGATIHAELIGFATNNDATHPTQPTAETIELAMRMALADAGVAGSDVGYVSAHATATELGDIAESMATERVYGSGARISSLKGHFGHTLGACGSMEAWLSIEMMKSGWFAPTRCLENVDERCAELDYLQGTGREFETDLIASNNFAFGGINTSLVFRRWQ